MSNAVWLADAEEAWVAAEIVGSASDSVTVKVLATNATATVALAAGASVDDAPTVERRNVFPAGSEGNAGVEDLITLPHLHEPAVLAP